MPTGIISSVLLLHLRIHFYPYNFPFISNVLRYDHYFCTLISLPTVPTSHHSQGLPGSNTDTASWEDHSTYLSALHARVIVCHQLLYPSFQIAAIHLFSQVQSNGVPLPRYNLRFLRNPSSFLSTMLLFKNSMQPWISTLSDLPQAWQTFVVRLWNENARPKTCSSRATTKAAKARAGGWIWG